MLEYGCSYQITFNKCIHDFVFIGTFYKDSILYFAFLEDSSGIHIQFPESYIKKHLVV